MNENNNQAAPKTFGIIDGSALRNQPHYFFECKLKIMGLLT
jgi:hypothetical protein